MWDQTTAAQQLVGLSRRTPPGSSPGAGVRQHQARKPICEALDLDDLQNFLSWDMYGMMDLGDTISVSGYETEGVRMSSEWASAI